MYTYMNNLYNYYDLYKKILVVIDVNSIEFKYYSFVLYTISKYTNHVLTSRFIAT